MKPFLCLVLIGLSGCDRRVVKKEEIIYYLDRQVYRDVFMECLRTVPPGPVRTHYNDWDEVVSQCRESAFSIAQREKVVRHGS